MLDKLKKGYVGLLVLHLLPFLNPWLIVELCLFLLLWQISSKLAKVISQDKFIKIFPDITIKALKEL